MENQEIVEGEFAELESTDSVIENEEQTEPKVIKTKKEMLQDISDAVKSKELPSHIAKYMREGLGVPASYYTKKKTNKKIRKNKKKLQKEARKTQR